MFIYSITCLLLYGLVDILFCTLNHHPILYDIFCWSGLSSMGHGELSQLSAMSVGQFLAHRKPNPVGSAHEGCCLYSKYNIDETLLFSGPQLLLSKKKGLWDFPGSPSNAGGKCSIPSRRAKIPHAAKKIKIFFKKEQ